MRRRRLEVGKLVPGTKLRVVGPAPSSGGNQCVMVRCEATVDGKVCGNEKVMRVTDMTRKRYWDKTGKKRLRHRSCGCQSKRTCREYWQKWAEVPPDRVRREVFRVRNSGVSFDDMAARSKTDKRLLTTIYRLEAQRRQGAANGPIIGSRPAIERHERDVVTTAAALTEHLRMFRELGGGTPAKRELECDNTSADHDWINAAAAERAWADQLSEAGRGAREMPANEPNEAAADPAPLEPLTEEAERKSLATRASESDEAAAEKAWLDQLSEEAERESLAKDERERR